MSEKSAFRRCGRDLVEFFNDTGWAFYVKLACRAVTASRLRGSNLPHAGFWPTSCWHTANPQSLVGFPEVFFSRRQTVNLCEVLLSPTDTKLRIARHSLAASNLYADLPIPSSGGVRSAERRREIPFPHCPSSQYCPAVKSTTSQGSRQSRSAITWLPCLTCFGSGWEPCFACFGRAAV